MGSSQPWSPILIGCLRNRSSPSHSLINALPPPTVADNHRPQGRGGHTFRWFCHSLHGDAFWLTKRFKIWLVLFAKKFCHFLRTHRLRGCAVPNPRWRGFLRTWTQICIRTRLPQAITTACTNRRSPLLCRSPRRRTAVFTTTSSQGTAPGLPLASSALTSTTAAPRALCHILMQSHTTWVLILRMVHTALTAPTPLLLQPRQVIFLPGKCAHFIDFYAFCLWCRITSDHLPGHKFQKWFMQCD